ncbi:FAD/NAD(P)-binding domain-containing protein [Lojkania enalia]|uniref:FAD/NAD(P)-binding domain-containing protein n=1 Tax=Lojkania enalia TaxID=147567 RepID=A0A9P4N4R8_9PLEO|nr:FAD/NAD(P)-binding domain-containing protein [Didymosphaeria enalia]
MHIHDVLIVGAGPCGLAVAARLREHTPSATFTDDEHQRYHWIKKHGRCMNIRNYKTGRDSLNRPSPSSRSSNYESHGEARGVEQGVDILVLDAEGAAWMVRWQRLFKAFEIDYLRSPMFFHVDPADRDALLGYAYEKEREKELQALPGCVGKEVSKHRQKKKWKTVRRMSQGGPDVDERDRKDYYTPSNNLFEAHCNEVVRRYGLRDGLIRQERVTSINYEALTYFYGENESNDTVDDPLDNLTKIFRVSTDRGAHLARVVVLAVGPGNSPSIPPVLGIESSNIHEGYTHAMQIKQLPPPHVMSKIQARKPTNLLIVGGGLTSVQLTDVVVKRGVDRVHLLMRGPLKVKYFDIELDWIGKFRNINQAVFWSADSDEERFKMISEARNGGSITPRYRKILDAHVKTGKVSLHTFTELRSVSWDAHAKTWNKLTSSPMVEFPPIDFIIFATGVHTNVSKIPFMQSFIQRHPTDMVGGLPCLNDDLMWSNDVPLFITGRLAGLRLGPGAPNLVGARVGAERIAWNVEDVLRKLRSHKRSFGSGEREDDEDGGIERLREYVAGRRNRFDTLINVFEEE